MPAGGITQLEHSGHITASGFCPAGPAVSASGERIAGSRSVRRIMCEHAPQRAASAPCVYCSTAPQPPCGQRTSRPGSAGSVWPHRPHRARDMLPAEGNCNTAAQPGHAASAPDAGARPSSYSSFSPFPSACSASTCSSASCCAIRKPQRHLRLCSRCKHSHARRCSRAAEKHSAHHLPSLPPLALAFLFLGSLSLAIAVVVELTNTSRYRKHRCMLMSGISKAMALTLPKLS